MSDDLQNRIDAATDAVNEYRPHYERMQMQWWATAEEMERRMRAVYVLVERREKERLSLLEAS